MIAGLASTLPKALSSGLVHQGVSHHAAVQVGNLPPTSSLFAALPGVNPLQHALQATGFALSSLPSANQLMITGTEFFPHLISGAFYHGLSEVFAFSAALAVIAGLASLPRGRRGDPTATDKAQPPVPTAPRPTTTTPHERGQQCHSAPSTRKRRSSSSTCKKESSTRTPAT